MLKPNFELVNKNALWLVVVVVSIGLTAWLGRETQPTTSQSPQPMVLNSSTPGPAGTPASDTPVLDIITNYYAFLAAKEYLAAYQLIVPAFEYKSGLAVKAGWSNEDFARNWSKSEKADPVIDRIGSVTRPSRDRLDAEVWLVGNHGPITARLVRQEGQWYLLEPPQLGVRVSDF